MPSRRRIALILFAFILLGLAACDAQDASAPTTLPEATAAPTTAAPETPVEEAPADTRLGDLRYAVPDGWHRVIRDSGLHELFAAAPEDRSRGYARLLFLPYPEAPPFETLSELQQYDYLRTFTERLAAETGMVYERADNTYLLYEAAIRFDVTLDPNVRPDVTSRGAFGFTPRGHLMVTVCYPPEPDRAADILDGMLASLVFDDIGDGQLPEDYRAALATAETVNAKLHFSRQKLYDFLRSEDGGGHTAAAANYAVGHIEADWAANAKTVAEIFAREFNLSHEGIHRQLLSRDGNAFTADEAACAMDGLEADWAANARARAREYREEGMEPETIYNQLFSIDLFTAEEARQAVDALD